MRIAFKQGNEHIPLRYKVISGKVGTSPIKHTSTEILPTSAISQKVTEQGNKTNKVNIFSNRSDLMIATSSISMHLPERLRRDIVKQVAEILNPEHLNYDGCLINISSFLEFLKFIVLKKIRPAAYSVSAKGNFMASWFHQDDRIHIEFIEENLFCTIVSKKNADKFEYYAHSGDSFALEKFIDNNGFSEWLYET